MAKAKSSAKKSAKKAAKKPAKKATVKGKAKAAWQSAPAVADVVVSQPTKKEMALKALAAPPTQPRPKRIPRRRFPPRVEEGEERQMFSATLPRAAAMAIAAAAAPDPGEDLAVVRNTELDGPGKKKTASNVGEPSVAVNGDVVFFTGN